MRRRLAAIVLVASPMLAGCAGAGGSEGDCNARIRYDGALFRPDQALPASVPASEPLGRAEVVGCGDLDDAPTIGEVTVHAVRGASPSVAMTVRQGDWRGVYVVEGLPRSRWPDALRPSS